MSLLEIKNVSKTFVNTSGEKITANKDICLSINSGETYGIVGESGSGKSTLASLIAMIDSVDDGEIYFEGKCISTLKGEKQRQVRRNIQMVFQNSGEVFYPRMKVKNIICEPLLNFKLIKKSEVKKVATELLKQVELSEEYADKYPHSMSGGQLQRVGIARALALNPKLIILDEATSALDVCIQSKIIELLARIQKERNITMIFICHDIGLIKSLADTVCIMKDGRVVEVLPADKLGREDNDKYTKLLLDSVFSIRNKSVV